MGCRRTPPRRLLHAPPPSRVGGGVRIHSKNARMSVRYSVWHNAKHDTGCWAMNYQILVLPRLMQQNILMDEECVLVVWLIIGQWITKLSARGAAASNPSRFLGSEFGFSARPPTPPPSPSAPASPWCAGGPWAWMEGGCPTWFRVWGLGFMVYG